MTCTNDQDGLSVVFKSHDLPVFPEYKATSSSPDGLLISPQREFMRRDRS